ncbi:MAG: ribosomal protein S18-alanine N-acetyltransferase [Clostridia bacterium]|nr:ribosomal protein S18-alanine N-acetyltransferase [Clostridia bacterium]
MNIEIKEMTITELNDIKDILTSDFDDFWNYNILKEELKSKNSKYIIAIINREIVGFAGIKIILDESDIMNIVTKKNYRNKGIGSLLLENLITISNNLNLNSITLEVNEENMPAIRLYEKFGFRHLGVRKNYYKDKNGIIMTKTLNH